MGVQRNAVRRASLWLRKGKQTFDMASGVSQVEYVFDMCRYVGAHFLVFRDLSCSTFGFPWTLYRLVGARMRTSVSVKLSSIGMGSVNGSL